MSQGKRVGFYVPKDKGKHCCVILHFECLDWTNKQSLIKVVFYHPYQNGGWKATLTPFKLFTTASILSDLWKCILVTITTFIRILNFQNLSQWGRGGARSSNSMKKHCFVNPSSFWKSRLGEKRFLHLGYDNEKYPQK